MGRGLQVIGHGEQDGDVSFCSSVTDISETELKIAKSRVCSN
jgi:hypothetical protein